MIDETKAAVTVAEMARMCSLGRSRFYQLIGSAFPEPTRDDRGRPYYTAEQQAVCLEVRRRNCGIDGRPILFYAPRRTAPAPVVRRRAKPTLPPMNRYSEIVEGIRCLGLTSVTTADVDAAVRRLFPAGTDGVDPGEIIRAVFLSVKRQDRPDNVR